MILPLLLWLGCARAPDVVAASPPEEATAEQATAAPATADPAATKATPAARAPAEGASLYQLDVELLDHHGEHVPLHLFRGQPVLVTMVYASCTTACPTILTEVKRMEDALPPAEREQLRVLVVSFDPDRDTPEALEALAEAHGVGEDPRWRLASAPADDVRALAAVLGVRYRQLSNGHFNHSSVFVLLDREGVIDARVEGLERPHDPILTGVHAIVAQGS